MNIKCQTLISKGIQYTFYDHHNNNYKSSYVMI